MKTNLDFDSTEREIHEMKEKGTRGMLREDAFGRKRKRK